MWIQQIGQTLGGPAACERRRQVLRSEVEKRRKTVSWRPAGDRQRRQACREGGAHAAERTPSRHRRPSAPDDADAKRAVERLTDEPGISVWSARSKPGSMPASSGNSRMSDRQNASIVEMAISARPSRKSRHLAADIWRRAVGLSEPRDDALPHFAAAFLVNVIARICSGSTPPAAG
jgi:hypothetical protein